MIAKCWAVLWLLIFALPIFLSVAKAERIYGGHFDYEPVSRVLNDGRTERGYRISLDVAMQCLPQEREMQSVNVFIFAFDANGMIIQDNVVLSFISRETKVHSPDCGCSNNSVCTRKIRYRADYYPSDLDIADMQLFLTTSESVSDLGVCCLSQRPPVNLPPNNQNNMYSITAILPALSSDEATLAFNWSNTSMESHDDVIFVCENDNPDYIDPIRYLPLGLAQPLPNGFTYSYQLVSPYKSTATQFLNTYPILPDLQYANGYTSTTPLGTDGTVTVDATEGILGVSGLRVDLNFPSRNRDFVVCVEVTVRKQNSQIVYVGRRFMMVSSYKKYDYATVTSTQLLNDIGFPNNNGVLNLLGGHVSIETELIVDNFIQVTGGRIDFGPTARITNEQPNSYFESNNCQIGCCPNNVRYTQFSPPLQGMWDGIVADQGRVVITNNSLLECARIGIDQSSDAIVEVINSTANENWRHWYIHDLALPLFPSSPSPVQVTVYGSTFQCERQLMDEPLPNIDTHTQDGIFIERITGMVTQVSPPPFGNNVIPRIIEIGRINEAPNLFRDILNNGISANATSDVYILNSNFNARNNRPAMRTGIYATNSGINQFPSQRQDYTIFVGRDRNGQFAPCTLSNIGRGIELEKTPNTTSFPISRNIMSLRVDGCRFVNLGDQYWSYGNGHGVWVHGLFQNRNDNENHRREGTRHVGNTVAINGCTYRSSDTPLPFKDFTTAFEVEDAQHEGIFTNNDIRKTNIGEHENENIGFMSKGIAMGWNNLNDNIEPTKPRFIAEGNVIRNCQQAIIFGQPAVSNDELIIRDNDLRNVYRGIWVMGAENGLVETNIINNVRKLDRLFDNNNNFIRCSNDWGANGNPGFAGIIIQNTHNMRIFSNIVTNQVLDNPPTTIAGWAAVEEGCDINNNNEIDYNDSRSWKTGFLFSDGMWGGSNQGLNVCDNTARNMIYGFCYRGDNSINNRFKLNDMRNNLWNFVVDENGRIGRQESQVIVTDPFQFPPIASVHRVSHMNQWRNNLQRGTDGHNNPIRINLAARENTITVTQQGIVQSSFLTRTGQDFHNPIRNFQGVPFTNYFDQQACGVSLPCSIQVETYSGLEFIPVWEQTGCGDNEVAPSGEPNPAPLLVYNTNLPQINDMVHTARGNVGFAYLQAEQTYNAQYNLFRYINRDTAWRHRNPVIDSFYVVHATDNMGRLLYAEQLLFGGASQPPCNASAAGTACSAVIPANQQEENLKNLLGMLALNQTHNTDTLTPGQRDTLRNIARQCPETGGYAVGMARTIYTLKYGYALDSVQHCNPNYVPPPRLGHFTEQDKRTNQDKISVYPNPASDEINIKFNPNIYSGLQLEIYSITGVQLQNSFITGGEESVKTDGFTDGVYLCKFSDANGNLVQTQKLIIRK